MILENNTRKIHYDLYISHYRLNFGRNALCLHYELGKYAVTIHSPFFSTRSLLHIIND